MKRMKKIECIIPARKFDEVERKLREAGIRGMTVVEVKGYGNQQTRPESYLLLPKTKIEIYCQNDEVEEMVGIITQCCQTGQLGDGKIAVLEVAEIVRIRTGERGVMAV